MTQAVDSDAILEAARVYASVRTAAAAATNGLVGVLQGSAGMAGTDNGAHAWAAQYDPLAKALVDASASVINGAGKCADLLGATAVNHRNADAQSAINPPELWPPPIESPTYPAPPVASAEGGHGDVPGWWHTISAYVEGELWPNGHQDKLRAAHDAWEKGGRELRAAAQLVNGGTSSMGAIAALMDQRSPEIPAMLANCALERDQMKSVADGFDSAAQACSEYAQEIDEAHSKILHEMAVLGSTVAVTEVVAAVLIPFTLGASEAVSKVVDVARLAATGARIANIIREFKVAAELSGLPAVSAAGAAARTVSELAALLSTRVRIFLSEVSGRAAAERADLQRLSEESVKKKLDGYLLNPENTKGGAEKAEWFRQALGFTRENSDDLAGQIVFDEGKAVEFSVTDFGTQYNQVISITGASGKIIDVKFGWIRNSDGVVRLVTAIPTKR
jgi:hypothetical protein